MSASILLHKAVEQNRIDIMKWLIDNGVKTDSKKQNQTPLHVAVRLLKDPLEVVKCLIENGADTNAKDSDGNAPLHFATGNDSLEVVKCLIENGADTNLKGSGEMTPLHFAASNSSLEIVKCLIENRADIDAKNLDGKTALHKASDFGPLYDDIGKFLIEKGAQIDLKDRQVYTMLL